MNRSRATRVARPIVVAVALHLGLYSWAIAGGLTCSVGEVVIENLKIGQSYSLTSLAQVPLAITNSQAHAVRVIIEPLIPASSELRQGAEPVPDLAWAAASPETLDLAAGETKSVELMLTIPDDARLFGRRFQVNFWSHTQPRSGEQIAFGLKSRVIFSVDRERETPGAVPLGDLSLTLLPAELRLAPIGRGRPVRLEDIATQPLRIRNTSAHAVTVALEALSAEAAGVTLSEGRGDLMLAATVTLLPATFSLAPGEERTISGTLSLDNGGKLTERDLEGVISVSITNMPVKTRIFARIRAHVW